MIYVLVNKKNSIVDRVDLGSGVGVSGARTYFIKRKQIGDKEFDSLWKVIAETEYNRLKVHNETLKEYEEFGNWLDVEKS